MNQGTDTAISRPLWQGGVCAIFLLVWVICAVAFFPAAAASSEPNETTSAKINFSQPGLEVPKSFLGFSREWRPFLSAPGQSDATVHPTYLQLVRQLCAFNNAPLSFRIGGNSTESMRVPPATERWQQLAAIYEVTRTPLIINLNLSRGDANLNLAMIREAKKYLPAGAIATFELGNEPDGWTGKHRDTPFNFAQYLTEYKRLGQRLAPVATPGLAGPAWAHGAPPQVMTDFLAAQGNLINLLTAHSYRFDPAKTQSLEKLLSESNTAGFAANFTDGVKVARQAGIPLRLTETGSAWGGGIAGFSDTFAATLWTVDVLFELATIGVDGVNFHNVGTNPYSIIQEDRDPVTQTSIITANTPFYGMLLFAEATANKARIIPVDQPPGKLKLWATQDDKGVTRVVIINRDSQAEHEITLEVPGAVATVKRLSAPSIAATRGIVFAGQTYDDSKDGNPVGQRVEETFAIADGKLRQKLSSASAVLLTISASVDADLRNAPKTKRDMAKAGGD